MALADIFSQMMKKGEGKIGPDDAQRMAAKGRNGDSIIAHINPREAAILKALGGSGTINPETGALEFFEEGEGPDTGPSSASPNSEAPSGGGSFGGSFGLDGPNLGGGGGTSLGGGYSAGSGFSTGGANLGGGRGSYGGSASSSGPSQDAGPSLGGGYSPGSGFGLDGPNLGGNSNNGTSLGGGGFGSGDTPAFGLGGAQTGAGSVSSPAPSPATAEHGNFGFGGVGYNGTDAYGGGTQSIADTVAAALGGPAAGSGQADTSSLTGGAPGTAVGSGGAAAGAIAPEAALGWNPLGGAQATLPDAGRQPQIATVDGGERVYANDPTSLGNLRGFRDNSDFQVDGFHVPGTEGAQAYAASGLGTIGDDQPKGVSTWATPEGATFGLGKEIARGGIAATDGRGFSVGGYNPAADAAVPPGTQVPEMSPRYRSVDSFDTPIANAMQAAYSKYPGLPGGYLEGSYGNESLYGKMLDGGTYQGPMQFSAKSINDFGQGRTYNPRNAADSMDAMGLEYNRMTKMLGREPTADEAYQMHQQGVGYGLNMLQNPDKYVSEIAAAGHPNLPGNLASNHIPDTILGGQFMTTPRTTGAPAFGDKFGFASDYANAAQLGTPINGPSMFR